MLQQSGRHSGWQISRLLWVVWLRLLHVISAMVYVGGHILENLLLYRFEASGGRMRVLKAIDAAEPSDQRGSSDHDRDGCLNGGH